MPSESTPPAGLKPEKRKHAQQESASQQTLGELASNFELYGLCTVCKRMPQLNIEQLIKVLGDDTTVDSVRRKLVCNRCGRRTRNIRVVYRGPQGGAAAFRYLASSNPPPPEDLKEGSKEG